MRVARLALQLIVGRFIGEASIRNFEHLRLGFHQSVTASAVREGIEAFNLDLLFLNVVPHFVLNCKQYVFFFLFFSKSFPFLTSHLADHACILTTAFAFFMTMHYVVQKCSHGFFGLKLLFISGSEVHTRLLALTELGCGLVFGFFVVGDAVAVLSGAGLFL